VIDDGIQVKSISLCVLCRAIANIRKNLHILETPKCEAVYLHKNIFFTPHRRGMRRWVNLRFFGLIGMSLTCPDNYRYLYKLQVLLVQVLYGIECDVNRIK
jgi:hypothetical protein